MPRLVRRWQNKIARGPSRWSDLVMGAVDLSCWAVARFSVKSMASTNRRVQQEVGNFERTQNSVLQKNNVMIPYKISQL